VLHQAATRDREWTERAKVKVVELKSELRTILADERSAGQTVGLVPTMGALHNGHASLLQHASELCDVTVMSLFVNPTQFAPNEDLNSYPRSLAQDIEVAKANGVKYLFAPTVEEMYSSKQLTTVSVAQLTDTLCGTSRGAAHFSGVTTVVCKLLNIAQPDVALFGQKDAQQLAIIKQMVKDLDIPTAIVGCPTVREVDGLAMSSRNRYLDAKERKQATAISKALAASSKAVEDGERVSERILSNAHSELKKAAVSTEYLELVSPETLQPIKELTSSGLLAIAARVGSARLIDNTLLTVKE